MEIDLKKFYAVGRGLVGQNGMDLVHISYEIFMCADVKPKDIDAYFYSIMLNQVKNKYSRYTKNYSRIENQNFDTLECEYFDIDTENIKRIIQQLKKEGRYLYEVKAFEELAQTKNYLEFTRKTGIRYETIIRIITFVRKQILNEQDEPWVIRNKTAERLKKHFEA